MTDHSASNLNEEQPTCSNCGEPLYGTYCSACGQKDEPLRQPVRHFLRETTLELLGVDGRLWRSLGLLLTRPGRLTTEYLSGQRVRYLRPLRLYFTSSLVFFFILTVTGSVVQTSTEGVVAADSTLTVSAYQTVLADRLNDHDRRIADQGGTVDSLRALVATDSVRLASTGGYSSDEDYEEHVDGLVGAEEGLDRLLDRQMEAETEIDWIREQLLGAPPDSVVRPADLELAASLVLHPDTGPGLDIDLPSWLPESDTVRRLRNARTGEEAAAAFSAFGAEILRRLPTVMFLLLPVYALILKVLYSRHDWYYTEHLVFGLHTHAFVFITFTIARLLSVLSGEAVWAQVLAALLILYAPFYTLIAQKRVYRQRWLKTIVKSFLLGNIYGFMLFLGALVTLLLAATF